MNIIPTDELWALPSMRDGDWFHSNQLLVELGNKKNAKGLYRTQYEAAGLRYACIDWNAEDGAVALDFGIPLPEEWFGIANLVTNFGFTEHVFTDQFQAWDNLARLSSKIGCWLGIVLPSPGHWPRHGVFQPREAFIRRWLISNGYNIHLGMTNVDRKRHVSVFRARRAEVYKGPQWQFDPMDSKWFHITRPKDRQLIEERNCGVE